MPGLRLTWISLPGIALTGIALTRVSLTGIVLTGVTWQLVINTVATIVTFLMVPWNRDQD